MADADLKIRIGAVDKASNAIQKVKKAVAGLIGAYLGYKAAHGAVRFIGDSAKAAMEAEQSVAKLGAVLKSTGNAYGWTIDELSDFASQMQRTTTLTDDQVMSAQALGLTFTSIGKEVFPGFMQAAADMSQALGYDMRQSVIQLGKALQDPQYGVTALRRVGVNTAELQAKMTDAMPLMEKQRLILKEINTEFGGMAEAMGATFQGTITRIKNQFGEVQEKLGGAIVNSQAWRDFLGEIMGKIDQLNDWLEANEEKIEAWGRVALDTIKTIGTWALEAAKGVVTFAQAWRELWGGETKQRIKEQEMQMELVSEALARYKGWLAEGKISQDQYNMAVQKLSQLQQQWTADMQASTRELNFETNAMRAAAAAAKGYMREITPTPPPDLEERGKTFRTFVDRYMVEPIKEVKLVASDSAVGMIQAFEEVRMAAFDFAVTWTNNVIDSIVEGRFEFGRFVQEFITGMIKMLAKMAAFKILASAFNIQTGGAGFLFQHGGMVPGTGVGDSVPAMLTPGEFVLNRAAVARIGAGNLAAINRGDTFNNSMNFNITLGPGSGQVQARQFMAEVERELPNMLRRAKQWRRL